MTSRLAGPLVGEATLLLQLGDTAKEKSTADSRGGDIAAVTIECHGVARPIIDLDLDLVRPTRGRHAGDERCTNEQVP
jgi:hypothetical protein